MTLELVRYTLNNSWKYCAREIVQITDPNGRVYPCSYEIGIFGGNVEDGLKITEPLQLYHFYDSIVNMIYAPYHFQRMRSYIFREQCSDTTALHDAHSALNLIRELDILVQETNFKAGDYIYAGYRYLPVLDDEQE